MMQQESLFVCLFVYKAWRFENSVAIFYNRIFHESGLQYDNNSIVQMNFEGAFHDSQPQLQQN